MNHKDFFNSLAETWDTISHHSTEKLDEIINLANIKEGSDILDVGTGTGVLIPFLISRIGNTGQITAEDVAEKMLEVAKTKYSYSNLEFICGDITELELPKNHFDTIMCYSVFPHFEDKQNAVLKMSETLKDKGAIVICHSQSRNEINNLHKKASDTISEDNLPDVETLKIYLSNAGLNTIMVVDDEKMFVVIGQK